jgi:hypothetical protein
VLRPTPVTWLMLLLPLVVWASLVAIGWDGPALLALLVAVELPFRLWGGLGLPVGHRTDFYGWPSPNTLGLTLIILTDLVAWYLVSTAVAAAWRIVRRARA